MRNRNYYSACAVFTMFSYIKREGGLEITQLYFLADSGSLWVVLVHYGSFWIILDHYG